MIDFHSHILPAIDDGSKSLEQTENMLRLSWEQGVRHQVATPHFYADEMVPEDFLENRQRAYEQVLSLEGDLPEIHLGAEVAYFSGISRSEAMQQLQIGNSGLLLVEMPFVTWTDRVVKDVCQRMDRQGLTPVLAHVDRYAQRNCFPKYRDMLLSNGVLFQMNASAFLKRPDRNFALKQLKAGAIHFLGSDCHNTTTRTPNLGEAVQVIQKKIGDFAIPEIMDFSAQVLSIL